ncbi:phosphopantetheine-binding protein [Streptomyces californicus]|uniref:phosphopantetheine-binding protein n=1 Tax=Streptomyces californicus TaxID=67351 RepID=UPI000516C287|nr:phosphopantetheine-binding protein [Streptomyces californicus]MDW4918678.1 phosphopantetheine-binding protein [Streptomyces californicus]QRV59564.1 hypothetical protein I6J40_35600 [Streptomyces californicus]
MTHDDVLHTLMPLVRARVDPTQEEKTDFTARTRLEQDLRMDSMTIVHVLEDVEDYYQLTIPDELLADVRTVGDLVDIVQSAEATPGRAA